MIVEIDFVDVESPHFEIMLDELGDLFVSVCVFPSLEADYRVPPCGYVALTSLRMTSSLLFLGRTMLAVPLQPLPTAIQTDVQEQWGLGVIPSQRYRNNDPIQQVPSTRRV